MVQPARQDLQFVRGDDYSIDLTMTTNGTTGISVAGWSAMKAFVRHRQDYPKLAAFTVSVINTTGGVLRFALTSGQTQTFPAACVWDFERVETAKLATVVSGFITVIPDVSYGT